jgi:lipopolysaccharide export LptBFGC system permease protein LptF
VEERRTFLALLSCGVNMRDLIFAVLTIAFFLVGIAYVFGCDRLK